jgi:hypothetical protein
LAEGVSLARPPRHPTPQGAAAITEETATEPARPWLAVALVTMFVAALGIAAGAWFWIGSPRAARPAPPHASAGANAIGTTGTTSPGARASPGGTAGSTATSTVPDPETGEVTETTATVVAGPPGPYGPTAAWVSTENARPGTRAWALTRRSANHEIEGYADHVSVDVSGTVKLYVSTSAPSFHVEAYRMGYYQGAGGRLIWTSPPIPGGVQRPFTLAPGTNMVEAAWKPSLTIQTDASWPQGQYLFKLVAGTGFQSYVPLTIRDDSSTATYVVNSDVTTWQAYNLYGGYDLYQGATGRSRVVSFDRPYFLAPVGGDGGSGDFLGNEFHIVSLVESLGLDVTYSTDIDLHEHPERLLTHKAFLSLGHDEYYSLAMRNGLQAARDRGVNLVLFGANAIYRHIRLEPSPLGADRHEVDYKSARDDPLFGHNNADVTPPAWRDPPNNNPESVIIGNYYQCNPVTADMVINDASSWVFQGTGVTRGRHLAGLVGTEYDHYDPRAPGPRNVTVLARSPLTCRGRPDFADMTYYTAPSGAGVFATGTLNWIPALNPTCSLPCPGSVVTRVTENILGAFGAGPAGHQHPSSANYQTLKIPGASPSPSPPAPNPPGPSHS